MSNRTWSVSNTDNSDPYYYCEGVSHNTLCVILVLSWFQIMDSVLVKTTGYCDSSVRIANKVFLFAMVLNRTVSHKFIITTPTL